MTFSWAIIGPGSIANRFASALTGVDGARLHCVLGRDAARSARFAARWRNLDGSVPAVGGELGTMLEDPRVDAIYIATPHSHHVPFVEQCLRARKPVLCEKPLVVNQADARRLVALARERETFLMEALWTRFLPVYRTVGRWLREGVIGRVRVINSSFCFAPNFDPKSRLFDPALAGGVLLDTGVYNLSMSRWVIERSLGRACPEPLRISVHGALAPTGVDRRVSGILDFADGLVVQFVCASDCLADNALQICGEKGRITIGGRFWEAKQAALVLPDREPEVIHEPFRVNGFEYEIEEATRCIREARIQSESISHEETCATLGWMDEIRRQIGVRYPFET